MINSIDIYYKKMSYILKLTKDTNIYKYTIYFENLTLI